MEHNTRGLAKVVTTLNICNFFLSNYVHVFSLESYTLKKVQCPANRSSLASDLINKILILALKHFVNGLISEFYHTIFVPY